MGQRARELDPLGVTAAMSDGFYFKPGTTTKPFGNCAGW